MKTNKINNMKNEYYQKEKESLETFERFCKVLLKITIIIGAIFVIVNIYKWFNN